MTDDATLPPSALMRPSASLREKADSVPVTTNASPPKGASADGAATAGAGSKSCSSLTPAASSFSTTA